MELQQFLAVIEEGSFADAASRLNLRPTRIAAPIRSPGRELGSELFVPGVTFPGLADVPSYEVGLVTLSGVGRRRPVVAFLDAYREHCRLAGRGDQEAVAAPPLTSLQLSRIA